MFKYTIFFLLFFSLSLFAQSESDFYTPPSIVGLEKNLVTDYAVNNADTLDDSKLLQLAIDEMSATTQGGKIVIPAGTYYLVEIKLASNIHLEFDKDAIIIPFNDTTLVNYSIFSLGKNTDYIENVKISAKSGKFTLDFRNLENKNVRVISLYSVNNFSVGDFKVMDDLTKFSAITGGISSHNDEWLMAKNGIVKNIEVHGAHYGYGVVQMQAGRNILFQNLWGDGGVTLRCETGYNKMNELQVGGVFDIYGKNIYCQNGNAALMISPHATKNGHVEVDSVTAVNCGFAVRIGNGYVSKKQDSLGVSPGYYANTSKVTNVVATYGETAQVKEKHFKYMPCEIRYLIANEFNPDGESYTAPSIAPVLNDAEGTGPGYYTVTFSHVSSSNYDYLDKEILTEVDAVEVCTTSIDETDGSEIQIFPNPSAKQFNIILGAHGLSSYKIYTLTGVLVENGNLKLSFNQIGGNLKSGTYLLNINGELDSITQLIIKE